MNSQENQQSFEGYMDVQSFFVDVTVPDQGEDRITWAVEHGGSFRDFFDSAPPELQERLIEAAHTHDEASSRTIIEAFAQFEASRKDETVH